MDLVVESARGPRLGEVLRSGRVMDLAGKSEMLGGDGPERFVNAPAGGRLSTSLVVDDRVTAGQHLGSIGDSVVRAPPDGWVRGLSYDGADVETGSKVVEVDASEALDSVTRISARAHHIAAGMCEAIGLV